MGSNFVHLNVHTAYSTAEGAIRLKDLASRCAELGMPAAAMTDSLTLAGAASFTKALLDKGVQPIVGVRIPLEVKGSRQTRSIALLAQNDEGFANLTKLVGTVATRGRTIATLTDLDQTAGGLLVLTGGHAGPLADLVRTADLSGANELLASLTGIFGDRLYVEIDRGLGNWTKAHEATLLELADRLRLPLIASNEAYFMEPSAHRAAEALLCIADGTYLATADRRHVSPNAWLKSPEEMHETFSDLPDALQNTVEIARRCSTHFKKRQPSLPAFPGCPVGTTEAEQLRKIATVGLSRRLAADEVPADQHQVYRDRLEFELATIERMGFPGYYLIVADFIGWAKDQGIPVGPGRGSGAGSLAAYATKITDIDPIKYGLLFERFLNPERISMPDFDIDFCQERREEAIRYVQQRYGVDRVAQIGTLGKLQARAALKDAGRVLGLPHLLVEHWSKLVTQDAAKPIGLGEAMKMEPLATDLVNAEPAIADMFALALKLEGLIRNVSTHAAGVVIADRPITEIVPCYQDKHGQIVTQYDMKAVEDSGLVKFDFLGLKTLSSLNWSLRLAASLGKNISLEAIGDGDDETFKMLAQGDCFGTFQMESAGMRDAMKKIAPTGIEDVSAAISLYRPGPMDQIDRYVAVKNGKEVPTYPHPILESILSKTHGVMIYQEQVMEIARAMAGYSMGQADLLRRAMGKKIAAEMDAQKIPFVEGCVKNGIDGAIADQVFQLMAKFAEYGFNRSHGVAYARIAVQTAYLKRHHPEEFFAGAMNIDIADVEKLSAFRTEMKARKVVMLVPDVNRSEAYFTIEKRQKGLAVRYALGAVRGVGVEAIAAMVKERTQRGPFSDFFDFVDRTAFLGNRTICNLIKAGALDRLGHNRASMLAGLELAVKEATAATVSQTQASFFSQGLLQTQAHQELQLLPELSALEKLEAEHDVLGIYLSGHPLSAYPDAGHLAGMEIAEIQRTDHNFSYSESVRFKAVVHKVQQKSIRDKATGDRRPMGVFILSDPTGVLEAAAFGDDFLAVRRVLREGALVAIRAEIRDVKGQRRISLKEAKPLKEALEAEAVAA